MAAQRTLVIEHIAAQRRPRLKHRRQRLADRRARDICRRSGEKALERARKADRRHPTNPRSYKPAILQTRDPTNPLTRYVDINILAACQTACRCLMEPQSTCATPVYACIC